MRARGTLARSVPSVQVPGRQHHPENERRAAETHGERGTRRDLLRRRRHVQETHRAADPTGENADGDLSGALQGALPEARRESAAAGAGRHSLLLQTAKALQEKYRRQKHALWVGHAQSAPRQRVRQDIQTQAGARQVPQHHDKTKRDERRRATAVCILILN